MLAGIGELPASHYMALLIALLVLALAGIVAAAHRRREREQRQHVKELRERVTEELSQVLGIQPAGQFGEAHEIGEQHRDLAMLRRGRLRRRRGRGRS